MQVSIVKRGSAATSAVVEIDGRRAFLKIFHRDEGRGDVTWRRERDALTLLKGVPGVPRHIAHSDDGRFLLVEFVSGQPLSAVLTASNALDWAERVGTWIATFESKAPFRPAKGSWREYIVNYPDLARAADGLGLSENLQGIPLGRTCLARCDGALSNLIAGDDGQLWGVDFERAQFKPAGWDLLLASESFVESGLVEAEKALESMVKGYTKSSAVTFTEPELAVLTRVFLLARLQRVVSGKGGDFGD
jgi:tRNA A-37 threonylcarbamoyl transferase component Bud32